MEAFSSLSELIREIDCEIWNPKETELPRHKAAQ
jgi:hypothetical protein